MSDRQIAGISLTAGFALILIASEKETGHRLQTCMLDWRPLLMRRKTEMPVS